MKYVPCYNLNVMKLSTNDKIIITICYSEGEFEQKDLNLLRPIKGDRKHNVKALLHSDMHFYYSQQCTWFS